MKTSIQSWSKAVEKSKESAEGHIENVVRLSIKIARAMGLDEDAINSVRQGAYLHDIGESLDTGFYYAQARTA